MHGVVLSSVIPVYVFPVAISLITPPSPYFSFTCKEVYFHCHHSSLSLFTSLNDLLFINLSSSLSQAVYISSFPHTSLFFFTSFHLYYSLSHPYVSLSTLLNVIFSYPVCLDSLSNSTCLILSTHLRSRLAEVKQRKKGVQ